MRKLGLKPAEAFLILAATGLFLASLAAYLTEFPLMGYLMGLGSEKSEQELGKVSQADGPLRREVMGQAEFKSIGANDTLFQGDTVATGPGGDAAIDLEDGGTVELGPQTMITLEEEQRFELGGIRRTTRLSLVSGQISARPASSPRKRRRVVIELRDRQVELAPGGPPKSITVSSAKPVIPPPRPLTPPVRSGVIASLLKALPFNSAPASAPHVEAATAPPSPSPGPSPSQGI